MSILVPSVTEEKEAEIVRRDVVGTSTNGCYWDVLFGFETSAIGAFAEELLLSHHCHDPMSQIGWFAAIRLI